MPDTIIDDDALERLRAAAAGAAAPLAEILDRFELAVTPPIAGDGTPIIGLVCRQEHLDADDDTPRGPTLLLPTVYDWHAEVDPAAAADAPPRGPLERLFAAATQKGMTLADLVEHALDHEADVHG